MLEKQQYVALANFRSELARFLRFSEGAARGAGITPTQYLLLLHVRGYPGRDWATVGELAGRLQASAHGTVALINRCVALGLVCKQRHVEDAREVEVHLTAEGKRLVQKIATRHRNELRPCVMCCRRLMSVEEAQAVPAARGSDFDARHRLIVLSAFALGIGVVGSFGAMILLTAIRLFNNLFFFQTLSLAARSPANHELGPLVILVPAIGGLMVGLMAPPSAARKSVAHGIPEALEAILFGKSRMSPKVAILKPLASGIAIGSGGPFGAEGPIIMTGGAAASLIAQTFHLTAGERKALLVSGACAGMTAVFGTPLAAVLLAVELLLFELRPRSLLPVALACAVAAFLRPLWGRKWTAVPDADAR